MGLETGTYIDDLVGTNPVGASDPKSQGDDHIRLLKNVLLNTFSGVDGAVPYTAAQFNDLTQAAAVETISGAWVVSGIMNFTTNFTIDGVDILTGAIPCSGNWVFSGTPNFTGDPTIDSQEIGFKNIPRVSKAVDYTAVLSDKGKMLYQTAASKTFTIPANASVVYPIGTAITFTVVNATGCSIAITSDTLHLAGTSTTGTRTLAQWGIATAVQVATGVWVISGAGLT